MIYAVVGLLFLLVGFSLATWIIYIPVIMRFFEERPHLIADQGRPMPDREDCRFQTADGLELHGTYLSTTAASRLGVVAFCHELTGNRWGATRYLEELRAEGFDVFTFDFRNHGRSDHLHGYQPMPWITEYELADVQAAVNYLCGRHDADPAGIGLMGVSKGATAAICAAARDKRIRAVVADGAYPIDGMQRHYIRRFAGFTRLAPLVARIPDVCLFSFCKWCKFLVGLRRGCRFLNVEQFAGSVRQPVFMIYGERDSYVPLSVIQEFRSTVAGRTKLWLVPDARHNGAVQLATELYHRRISRFFRRHLSGRSLSPRHQASAAVA